MKVFEIFFVGPPFNENVVCRECRGIIFYAKVREGTNFSEAICINCGTPSGFTTQGESIELALIRKEQLQAIAAGRPQDDWQQRIKMMMDD